MSIVLILVIAEHSTEKHVFGRKRIIDTNHTNQPATFSTADAMFVSRNLNSSGRVSRRACLPVTQRVTQTRMWEMMATGDVNSVLEESIKKINANTAQPESFLRQVFSVFMLVMLKKLLKVVATSFTHV